jgi:hypothetical protein
MPRLNPLFFSSEQPVVISITAKHAIVKYLNAEKMETCLNLKRGEKAFANLTTFVQ